MISSGCTRAFLGLRAMLDFAQVAPIAETLPYSTKTAYTLWRFCKPTKRSFRLHTAALQSCYFCDNYTVLYVNESRFDNGALSKCRHHRAPPSTNRVSRVKETKNRKQSVHLYAQWLHFFFVSVFCFPQPMFCTPSPMQPQK